MNCATGYRALLLLTAMMLGMSTANAAKFAAEIEQNIALTAKVKAALIADEVTRASQIHIETYLGIVQLSGFVATDGEKMHAEKLAASVPGVREVRNALEIRQRLADESGSKEIDDVARRVHSARQGGNEMQIAPAR